MNQNNFRIAKNSGRKRIFKDLYISYKKIVNKHKDLVGFYYSNIKLMHLIMEDVIYIFWKIAVSTGKKKENINAILDIYELNILHFFVAHYYSLKSGISLASYSFLRTVYENILRIYINLCYDDIAKITCEYETMFNDNLKKEEITKIEKIFADNYKFLSHKYIIPKLYDLETVKSYKYFYSHISSQVHTSIKSRSALYDLREDMIIDNLKVGIGLTFSNFILLFELHGDKIKKKYIAKIRKQIEVYKNLIPEGTPALIPTLKSCRDKLKIKSSDEFIQFLEKSNKKEKIVEKKMKTIFTYRS